MLLESYISIYVSCGLRMTFNCLVRTSTILLQSTTDLTPIPAQYLARKAQGFSDDQQLMQWMADTSMRRAEESVGVQSDCTTPDVIFTCREALEACNYAPTFPGQMSIPEVWFDHDLDTLLISLETVDENSRYPYGSFLKLDLFMGQIGPAAPFKDVKYLALALPLKGASFRPPPTGPSSARNFTALDWEESVLDLLGFFPNLEVLTFVAGVDEHWRYHRGAEHTFLDLDPPAKKPVVDADFVQQLQREPQFPRTLPPLPRTPPPLPRAPPPINTDVLQQLFAAAKKENSGLSVKLARFETKQLLPKSGRPRKEKVRLCI